MVNGTFLDLTEAMEKQGLSREEDFYTAVLDAGQWEGRQYILPLGFSVPLMVSAADVLNASSFDLQRAMHTMDSLLTELLRHSHVYEHSGYHQHRPAGCPGAAGSGLRGASGKAGYICRPPRTGTGEDFPHRGYRLRSCPRVVR